MLQPGDCSPSRNVVSKMVIVSDMVEIPANPRRESGVLSDVDREDSTDSRLPPPRNKISPETPGESQG